MRIIFHNSQFDRCIDYLNRSGGAAALAAKRAASLLDELANSTTPLETASCRPTRNGEARIRKCRKFDLGNGYRLVSIIQEGQIVPLFAGSHDDCNRWIENNRGAELKPVSLSESVELPALPVDPVEEIVEIDEDYDDELMARIGERELRMIFSGLWEKPPAPAR